MRSLRSKHKHENVANGITNIYLVDEGDIKEWYFVDEVRYAQ